MRAKRPGSNGNRGETTQEANRIQGETTWYPLPRMHFFSLSFMIRDWDSPSFLSRRIFFILVTLDLCLLLIHCDLWNSQKWQILISSLQYLS
jgi:hypothetical protein